MTYRQYQPSLARSEIGFTLYKFNIPPLRTGPFQDEHEERMRPEKHTAHLSVCGQKLFWIPVCKPEWQRALWGHRAGVEVNPEPETNLALHQSDRPLKILAVWLTNMQDSTHTHFSLLALTYFSEAPPPLLLPPCTCLTCLTASFVISNHLLFERLWHTGVLAASVWCWELGFSAE